MLSGFLFLWPEFETQKGSEKAGDEEAVSSSFSWFSGFQIILPNPAGKIPALRSENGLTSISASGLPRRRVSLPKSGYHRGLPSRSVP